MKKTGVILFLVAWLAVPAFAETTKDVAQKTGNFWSREAERSGLKESTSSWGSFWSNINPGKFFKDQKEAYDARKGGSVVK